ncbi:MAG: TIGR00730 family Rossman fold protein [Bacteroidota bacterium]
MKKIAVFCGANPGIDPIYASAAKGLAEVMAAQNMELVYGAGSVGLMGIIADRMLELGQPVLGVITQRLMDREVGHVGITDLRIVSTMHERKMLMADLADAFIAMPGGVGTLEEIVEAITFKNCWATA